MPGRALNDRRDRTRAAVPAAVVVGEPTEMVVVSGHKGIATWNVTVTGHEAHSSLIHLGASANMVAVRLMHQLADLADRLAGRGSARALLPHHATLTIGQMNGGTAINILARECRFAFDLRTLPGQEPEAILAPFFAACAAADAELRARFPKPGSGGAPLAHAVLRARGGRHGGAAGAALGG